ncbi:heparin lyase I family protein [Alsobacter sp. R-9]
MRAILGVGTVTAIIMTAGHAAIAAPDDPLPLYQKDGSTTLGPDLGSGKEYHFSLLYGFQSWGVMRVSKEQGYPVRLGQYGLRFETREGYCGFDQEWNDCKKGRNRHEIAGTKDAFNVEYWYSFSAYFPKQFGAKDRVGTTFFQIKGAPVDAWRLRFWKDRGIAFEYELNFQRKFLKSVAEISDRWNDFLVQFRHSRTSDGYVRIWLDGKLVHYFSGITADPNGKSSPYLKIGLYNTVMSASGNPVDGASNGNGQGLPNLVYYVDELRFGRNCADLKLSDLGYDCKKLSFQP